jgi:hypothetical protein
MDRMHVTRSYAAQVERKSRCMAKPAENLGLTEINSLRSLKLY